LEVTPALFGTERPGDTEPDREGKNAEACGRIPLRSRRIESRILFFIGSMAINSASEK
jgi:hypothetical protein